MSFRWRNELALALDHPGLARKTWLGTEQGSLLENPLLPCFPLPSPLPHKESHLSSLPELRLLSVCIITSSSSRRSPLRYHQPATLQHEHHDPKHQDDGCRLGSGRCHHGCSSDYHPTRSEAIRLRESRIDACAFMHRWRGWRLTQEVSPLQPDGIPYQVDTDTGPRGTQQGYNVSVCALIVDLVAGL